MPSSRHHKKGKTYVTIFTGQLILQLKKKYICKHSNHQMNKQRLDNKMFYLLIHRVSII